MSSRKIIDLIERLKAEKDSSVQVAMAQGLFELLAREQNKVKRPARSVHRSQAKAS